MANLRSFIYSHPQVVRLATGIQNALNCKNRILIKGVRLKLGCALLRGLKIVCTGKDNKIVIEDYVRIKHSKIIIRGSHNVITIKKHAILSDVEFYFEDDCNEVIIGQRTELYGPDKLSAIEGTKIKIGDDCLFSSDLHIRTGDSHSILNMEGKRINKSSDVVIGNHVWIGTRVTCLKGVEVPDNCIVAATTTLCKKYYDKNAIIAGVPGRTVKTGINWSNDRMLVEE